MLVSLVNLTRYRCQLSREELQNLPILTQLDFQANFCILILLINIVIFEDCFHREGRLIHYKVGCSRCWEWKVQYKRNYCLSIFLSYLESYCYIIDAESVIGLLVACCCVQELLSWVDDRFCHQFPVLTVFYNSWLFLW